MLRYCVLGMLTSGRPRPRESLMCEYASHSGPEPGIADFDRELRTLEREGFIEPLPHHPLGAPGCRAYEITYAGLAAFTEWFRNLPHGPHYNELELDTRARFFAQIAPLQAASALRVWRANLAQTAGVLQRELTGCLAGRGSARNTCALAVKRKLRHIAADYSFLEDLYDEFDLDGADASLDDP